MINIKQYIYDLKEVFNLIYADYNRVTKVIVFNLLLLGMFILIGELFYEHWKLVYKYFSSFYMIIFAVIVLVVTTIISYYITLYPYKKIDNFLKNKLIYLIDRDIDNNLDINISGYILEKIREKIWLELDKGRFIVPYNELSKRFVLPFFMRENVEVILANKLYSNYLEDVYSKNFYLNKNVLFPFYIKIFASYKGFLTYEVKAHLSKLQKKILINNKEKTILKDDFGFIFKGINGYIKKDLDMLWEKIESSKISYKFSYQLDYLLLLHNLVMLYIAIYDNIFHYKLELNDLENVFSLLGLRNFVFYNYEDLFNYSLLIMHIAVANRIVLSILFFNSNFIDLLLYSSNNILLFKKLRIYI